MGDVARRARAFAAIADPARLRVLDALVLGDTSRASSAVGAYIGAAYWFTSSTSFAKPAVTVGRVFSDTFAGIAPGSVPGFIAAQLIGAALVIALVRWLYPDLGAPGDTALDDVVVPHGHTRPAPERSTP